MSLAIFRPYDTLVCSNFGAVYLTATWKGVFPTGFIWYRNGVSINSGRQSEVFDTRTTLPQGDTITCEVITEDPCYINSRVTSKKFVIKNKNLPPSVSLTASTTQACRGASVTFTPIVSKRGLTNSFTWYKNNVYVFADSIYTTTDIANGDSIYCAVSHRDSCSDLKTITSNKVFMSITNTVTPSVTIATPTTTICSGTNITFTPTPTNGGTTPTYQWKKNGANVATTTTYSASNIANSDVISCILTSNAACPSTPTATSNNITMTVTPTVTPSVSIATPTATICAGASVTFTPTPTNGGTTPTYQWKKNGINVATTPTYTASDLANADVISCIMTSNVNCPSANTATSNTISMTVNANPSVSISPTTPAYCVGQSVTLAATTGLSVYQWSTGASTASISVNAAGTYALTVTNANGCKSNTSIAVTALAKPTVDFGFTIQGGKVTFNNLSTGATSYLWRFTDSTSTLTNPIVTYRANGNYSVCLVATNALNCKDSICRDVNVTRVSLRDLPDGMRITISPNPTTGKLTIGLNRQKPFQKTDKIRITDVLGRQLAQFQAQEGNNQLDLSAFANGTYFLSLTLDGSTYFLEKIIKQE